MTEETVVEVGEVRLAGGRAIVPIVRTRTVAGRWGIFLRAEPVALLIAGDDRTVLFSREDADVPKATVTEAAARAKQAL